MSYLLYLDDSKKHLKETSIGSIAGYIIKEADLHSFIAKINNIKKKYNLSEKDPIKWSPDRKVVYEPLKRISSANNFKIEILGALSQANVVILAGFHDAEKKKQDSYFEAPAAMGKVFSLLLSRYQFFLKEQNARGSVILAMPGDKKSKSFGDIFKTFKHDKVIIQSANWYSPALINVNLDRIEDAIYYCYEEHSTAVQIADFVVSSLCWTISEQNKSYYDIYSKKVRTFHNRKKGAGIIADPNYSSSFEILY